MDNNYQLLSPEEKQVKEILSNATMIINQLEDQIEKLPPGKGQPRLELVPRGGKSSLGRSRGEMEGLLREQQALIKDSVRTEVEKIADRVSGEPANIIRMDLDVWENPELYKNSFEERLSQEKDITDSQHVSLELLEIERSDIQNNLSQLEIPQEKRDSNYNIEFKSFSFLYTPERKTDKEFERDLDLDKE